MKPFLALLCIVFFLTVSACATNIPTSTPAPAQVSVDATVPALPSELTGILQTRFAMPMRVIPAAMNPATDFPRIAAQYLQTVTTSESAPLNWFGGTTSTDFWFSIEL